MGNWLSQTHPGEAPRLTEKTLPNQTGKARDRITSENLQAKNELIISDTVERTANDYPMARSSLSPVHQAVWAKSWFKSSTPMMQKSMSLHDPRRKLCR